MVAVAAAIALSSGSIARADRTPPVIPSQEQVDQAAATAAGKQQSVDQIQAALVTANARVLRAAQDAELAAEEYNGARWRLAQATQENQAATAALTQARAAVAQQRMTIASLVADSYQHGADLSAATVLLSKEGPEGVMNRVGVTRSANESMQVRFAAFKQAQREADVAQQRAAAAQQAQEQLLVKAQATKDAAAGAQAQAQAYSSQLGQQQDALSQQLAQAQNISTALANQRRAGLEARAAAQAAAQERARQAESQVSARQPQGRDDQDQGSSDQGSAADPPVNPDPPATGSGVGAAISYAKSKLGLPYRWGAAGPSSFDCSGLTMMAWRAGGKSLPHYSAAQYSTSTPISRSQLQPGDLVFWGSSPSRIHHVALYLGGGQILHAPRTGQAVRTDSIDYWIPPSYFARP